MTHSILVRATAEARFFFNTVKEALFHPASTSCIDKGTGNVITRRADGANEPRTEESVAQ